MKITLLHIVQDIILLRLSGYDLAPLHGTSGLRRIRKGKLRIIFTQEGNVGVIKKIDVRGNVYKGM
ncbi:MAG: hypothetical protein WC010_02535 [Candidatus Absconditabacterales bacterium]